MENSLEFCTNSCKMLCGTGRQADGDTAGRRGRAGLREGMAMAIMNATQPERS